MSLAGYFTLVRQSLTWFPPLSILLILQMLLALVPTPGHDKDLLLKEIEVSNTIIFFFEVLEKLKSTHSETVCL